MASVFLSGSSAANLARTQNPAATQNTDTSLTEFGVGRHGELHVSDVHGWYYAGASRGIVFSASAAGVTGVAPLAPGGTTSGFMAYNPASSGVNMEILEILTLPLTAIDVVGVLGIETGAPPTTVTNADLVHGHLVGSAKTSKGLASHGSTVVAMTFLRWLPSFVQTIGGVEQGSAGLYLPAGHLVIAPGGAINIVSSTTQGANLWAQSVTWSEWPV